MPGLADSMLMPWLLLVTSGVPSAALTVVGNVSTFAGTAGVPGYVDGPGLTATIQSPTGFATDAAGSVAVFVSETLAPSTTTTHAYPLHFTLTCS